MAGGTKGLEPQRKVAVATAECIKALPEVQGISQSWWRPAWKRHCGIQTGHWMDVLAGGGYFSLTFPSFFPHFSLTTFPWGFCLLVPALQQEMGQRLHCRELLMLPTGTGRTTTAFKTKAARRTKELCYEASPMWLVSFNFPWAADKVAEDVPDPFAKAQLPGKDLRISRDIAEPLRVFGLLVAAFVSI